MADKVWENRFAKGTAYQSGEGSDLTEGSAGRRQFLKGSIAIALATQMGGIPAIAAERRLEKIGLQLSTITPLMLADFEGALRDVAAIGYDQVEFSALGLLGRSPEKVKMLLAELNLEAPQGRLTPALPDGFYSLPRQQQRAIFLERGKREFLLENVRHSLQTAIALDQRYLILPITDRSGFESVAALQETIELFNRAGAICAQRGVQFGYHNHAFEFPRLDGVVPYDVLIEETDPELVSFQLDAYWVTKGGGDVLDYLDRYPGRFSSLHMKDIDDAGDFADVGDGNIDFPAVTRKALAQGVPYFFVERDGPPDPAESIRRSYAYLRKMTF